MFSQSTRPNQSCAIYGEQPLSPLASRPGAQDAQRPSTGSGAAALLLIGPTETSHCLLALWPRILRSARERAERSRQGMELPQRVTPLPGPYAGLLHFNPGGVAVGPEEFALPKGKHAGRRYPKLTRRDHRSDRLPVTVGFSTR
jgi:hypothetical protein